LRVTLGKLKVSAHKTEDHKVLTPLLAPLVAKTLQSRLQSGIEISLRNRFEDVVIQLNKFFAKHPLQRAAVKSKDLASNLKSKIPSKKHVEKARAEKPRVTPHHEKHQKEGVEKKEGHKTSPRDKTEKVEKKEVTKEKTHEHKSKDVSKDRARLAGSDEVDRTRKVTQSKQY